MAKTVEDAYVEQQIREAAGKSTVAEVLETMRARPGHKPYDGPPIAEIVREQRAEREAQIEKNLGL